MQDRLADMEEAFADHWASRVPRSLMEPSSATLELLESVDEAFSIAQHLLRLVSGDGGASLRERNARILASLELPSDEWDGIDKVDLLKATVDLFATLVTHLRETLLTKIPSLWRVEDEFASSASGIAQWKLPEPGPTFLASSVNELVFEFVLWLVSQALTAVRLEKGEATGLDIDPEEHEGLEPAALLNDLRKYWKAAAEQFAKFPPPTGESRLRLWVQSKQELCRAVDRRLVTKRVYPGDEKPLSENEVAILRLGTRTRVFVPTLLQVSILKALDGRVLKKEPLAEQCQVDPSRLYRPGGIKELMKLGKVIKKQGRGYFRPDAPPAGAIDLGAPPKGHQDATKPPPTSP